MIDRGSPNADAVFFGLQGFRIDGVEIRQGPSGYGSGQQVKVVTLGDLRGYHQCRTCRRRHDVGAFQESEPVRFRDCSLGDYETWIEVYPWRVGCCGKVAREAFPFEMDGFRMTVRFFDRIAALCTRCTIYEVALMAGLSWDTVCRVDKLAIEMAMGGRQPSLEGVRKIGIDEVSRTGGHVYFTIVTDLETGKVVHIGDGKGSDAMDAFVERLGTRADRIRVTASDLGYLEKLKKAFPDAIHVLDRFHIVQWANEALNKLRREIFGGGPKDETGKEFKAKKWMLLSGRENLQHGDKLLLRKLMDLNRPLYRAYLLKEELRGLFQHSWSYLGALRKRLANWCSATIRSGLETMQPVARRIRENTEAIVSGYAERVRVGLIEGTNSKIQKLRVMARGYRDHEYFKLKIFQRCSLPDNPWAATVL